MEAEKIKQAIIEIRKLMFCPPTGTWLLLHTTFDFINENLCDIEEAAGFQHHDCV